MSKTTLNILTLGVEDWAIQQMLSYWDKERITRITTTEQIDDLIDNPKKYKFCAAFCGSETRDITANEVAQFFRTQFPETPIFFISEIRDRYNTEELVRDGFHDVFIKPVDEELLKRVFDEISGVSDTANQDKFVSIQLIDLTPGVVIPFHIWIYLPVNGKHVRFSMSGQKLDKNRLDRLIAHNVNSVHIIKEDLPVFYEYSARSLAGKGKSETEQRTQIQSSVRNLLGSLFDESRNTNISTGKERMKHAQAIVSKYLHERTSNNWYDKIKQAISDSKNPYSHSMSTSTFAVLFSIGTGIGAPEDLALAGLLHDIGMVDVPAEIQKIDESERNESDNSLYYRHPEFSLKLIKRNKMLLSPNCMQAIKEHHEHFDGTGYPNKKSGESICMEARLLAIADKFDYITRVEPGKPYISPRVALQQMKDENAHFDPVLLSKIMDLVPEDSKAGDKAA